MTYRLAAIIFTQVILIQSVYSQCVNRVVSGCGCGPNIVPEYMIGAPMVSPQVIVERPLEASYAGIAPTIIQDSSVANSLANALQLLVVSNLLSNTLPGHGCEVIAPAFAPVEMLAPNFAPLEMLGGGLFTPYTTPCGIPGYNYIY